MIQRSSGRLRQRSCEKRYRVLQKLLAVESVKGPILDLDGGATSFFVTLFPRPEQVILIELDRDKALRAKQKQPASVVVLADGQRTPLADRSMAVTVCNSVIEHVDDPNALAAEIRRVSKRFLVQTPNAGFPLETHSFIPIPFYNLVPWPRARRLLCKAFGGWFEYVSSVRYLSEQKLRRLFPEAELTYERVLGLKKSFYILHFPPDLSPDG